MQRRVHVQQPSPVSWAYPGAGGRRRRALPGPLRVARGRLRTVLTLTGVLLIAAGTQVIPDIPVPPVPASQVAPAPPGLPFDIRAEANRQRLGAAAAGAEPAPAAAYQQILDSGRELLHFDPDGNRGRGSWIELVGTIDQATRTVGILVPGSGAFILDENFDKYHQRAADLVAQGGGRVAMVVWAAGTFPKGWLQGALTRYQAPLGRSLAQFTYEVRTELQRVQGPAATDTRVVVMGHSFGGAVVGAAERHGLVADAVLHIASAGMGMVSDPYDYPDPRRARYAMTAPGDLIGFAQGLPSPPGLGHGPAPDRFRCVTSLPTGRLPANATATDENGTTLGERAGAAIGGVSSHSEVFIRHSDAWWELYRVLVEAAPAPAECPPPEDPEQARVRILPLAVPRVVTVSQCRAGGGLRPRGCARPGRRSARTD